MCSKIAAKLMNSSDESSMGSAVYFSNRVFTENLKQRHTNQQGSEKLQRDAKQKEEQLLVFRMLDSHLQLCTVLYRSGQMYNCI